MHLFVEFVKNDDGFDVEYPKEVKENKGTKIFYNKISLLK